MKEKKKKPASMLQHRRERRTEDLLTGINSIRKYNLTQDPLSDKREIKKSKECCSLSYTRRLRRFEEEKELLRYRVPSPAEYNDAVKELAEAWQI